MALNTTGVAEHIQNISDELIVKSVFGNVTADLLKAAGRVIPGVKGKARLNLLDTDVTFTDGSVCGRSPQGDVSFSDVYIEVVPLKDESNLCPKAYETKWMSEKLTKGQTYTNLLFAEEIMADKAGKIAQENEKLAWGGSIALGVGNMGKADGFVTLIKAADHIALTATGADNVALLQNIWAEMPAVETEQADFTLFVSPQFYKNYKVALANKNIYQSTDDKTAFGTTASLVAVPGLGATEIVATRVSNLVMAVDLEGEEDKAELNYSIETGNFYMDFKFAIGFQIVNGEAIGYKA